MTKHDAVDLFKYESYYAALQGAATPPSNLRNRARHECDFGPGGRMIDSPGSISPALHRALSKDGKITLQRITQWLFSGQWQEGVAKIRDAFKNLVVPELPDIRRRGRWSDSGDTLNLDRLFSGNTETPWRTTHKSTTTTPPPMQIIVDISVNCDEEGRFWRGAAALALAEAAANVGYRIALDAVVNIENLSRSGAGMLVIARAKHYDAPVNLSSIACLLAHPASSQILDFAHCTKIPETMIGYGSVQRVGLERLRRYGALESGSVPILMSSHVTTEYDAREWLTETTQRLACWVENGGWEIESDE